MKTDSKRFSPLKFINGQGEEVRGNNANFKNMGKLYSSQYFCHYSNAVYMGGMNSFKKTGAGILLLDDGPCVITSHSHDTMNGHNIVFREKSMTSLLIDSLKNMNVCFRTGPYLLQFMMNSEGSIDGSGHLIDYEFKKIFKLVYRHSKLQKKIKIIDLQVNKRVFTDWDITGFIDTQHALALDFDFNLPENIRCFSNQNQYMIGFCKRLVDSKKKSTVLQSNGLIFRVKHNKNAENFNIEIQERGYNQKKMEKFGQKYFQNGNFYIGGFHDGKFHGEGVLNDRNTKKWTHGVYQQGKLIHLINSSVTNNQKISHKSIIQSIHKKQSSYIQGKIILKPALTILSQKLKQVISKDPYEESSQNNLQAQKQKQEKLKTIHEDYTKHHFQFRTEKAIKQLLGKQKINEQKNEKYTYQKEKQKPNFFSSHKKRSNQSKSRSKSHRGKKQTIQQTVFQQQEENIKNQRNSSSPLKKYQEHSNPNQLITGYFNSIHNNPVRASTSNGRTDYYHRILEAELRKDELSRRIKENDRIQQIREEQMKRQIQLQKLLRLKIDKMQRTTSKSPYKDMQNLNYGKEQLQEDVIYRRIMLNRENLKL